MLDNLIAGNHATYPGYRSLVKDEAVPVWETFNYTESRDSGYRLKYGNLDTGIAAHYQEVNAKNAVWSDQTQVFGSSQQNWKAAKTFGAIPSVICLVSVTRAISSLVSMTPSMARRHPIALAALPQR